MLSNAIKGAACLAGALLLCGTARAIGAELNVNYRGIRVTDPMGRDGLMESRLTSLDAWGRGSIR
jgi:hypothetical protein